MKLNSLISFSLTLLILASCNGSDNGHRGTVNRFVRSLNFSDSTLFSSYDSEVILYSNETERSKVPGEGDWFVIYDDRRDRYMAVRVGYVKGLTGYLYEEYLGELGDSFRTNEAFHRLFGNTDGDNGGDNYEAVDLGLDGFFYGRESGFTYEDEEVVTDVNLMAAEKEEYNFYKKVAAISYTYSIAPRSAAKLIKLGQKVQVMKKNFMGELSDADIKVVLADLKEISGISQEELLELYRDSESKNKLLKKAAKHIGSSVQNLEDRLLPELFGINL